MYSTTADRAFAFALQQTQDDAHRDTYGTTIPREARALATRIVGWVVLVGLVLAVLVPMLGHAWDVSHCQTVLDSFSGPTDHPEAVRCATLVK